MGKSFYIKENDSANQRLKGIPPFVIIKIMIFVALKKGKLKQNMIKSNLNSSSVEQEKVCLAR